MVLDLRLTRLVVVRQSIFLSLVGFLEFYIFADRAVSIDTAHLVGQTEIAVHMLN